MTAITQPLAPSRWRVAWRGIASLFRRAPLSAFWGVVAALIVAMAIAAPAIAPYPPL
jgi:hypothetical protein